MPENPVGASPAKETTREALWMRVLAPCLKPRARQVWLWIGVGFALRVILLPLFASVDLLSTAYVTAVLVDQHQLILSNEPPPFFYVEGGLYWLFHPLISSQLDTLFTASTAYTPAQTLETLAAQTGSINLVVAILKLPFLLADLTVAFVLPRFFANSRQGFAALLIWWFNPVSLYVSYMIGQYDVIAAAFLILAFYFLRSNREAWFVAALGLATFFELFAILVVPFVLIYRINRSPTLVGKAKKAGAVLLAPALAIVGLLLILHFQPPRYEPANLALTGYSLDGNFGNLVYNRGLTTAPILAGLWTYLGFSAQFSILSGLSDVILLVVFAYGVLLLLLDRTPHVTWDHLFAVSLASFLVFFALSGFLVQWVVWVLPFLTLMLAKDFRKLILPYLIFIGGFFMYAWYFRAVLWGNLLQISFPGVSGADPIASMDSAGLPGVLVVNVGRSLFSAACLWFAYLALRESFGSSPGDSKPVSNPSGPVAETD